MTLPLRKKLQTTVKNTHRQATAIKADWLVVALRTVVLGGSALCSSTAFSQVPSWQPTRIPSNSDAKPLSNQQSEGTSNSVSGLRASQGNPTSGVALRWQSVSRSAVPQDSVTPNHSPVATPTNLRSNSNTALANSTGLVKTAAASNSGATNGSVELAGGWTANPLRRDTAVRSANYQPPAGLPDSLGDPFGDRTAPMLPPTQDSLRSFPPSNAPTLPPSRQLPQSTQDPLSNVELPPVPVVEPKDLEQVSPFRPDSRSDLLRGEPSPFDKRPDPQSDPFGDSNKEGRKDNSGDEETGMEEEGQDRSSLELPKRDKNANTSSCNDLRDRVRQMRITDISLSTSPQYARKDAAKKRLDFAASAPIRNWTDYTGTIVASGRLVDLRDDRVVLDINGSERLITLRDLSDIDVAYVAQSWNLPPNCGVGYEAYAGRQFIPSAVEWKASGLCHKPLYFEDVQLERYGHEAGPVLQPLLSTVHFFGNAMILPYKMGIHPPGECQYPLGYYRPGDCAPYMIQPFPLSIRGAAVQAGFVTGAAALIP